MKAREEGTAPVHLNGGNPAFIFFDSPPNVSAEVFIKLVAWPVVLVQVCFELMAGGPSQGVGSDAEPQPAICETHRFCTSLMNSLQRATKRFALGCFSRSTPTLSPSYDMTTDVDVLRAC